VDHKVLIIGGSGMLGHEVFAKFQNIFNVVSTSFNNKNNSFKFLDITNRNQVKNICDYFNPNVVVNCAAFTDVDLCESHKKVARMVNVDGVENIIKSVKTNTKIIHISTDYVFNGVDGFYSENDLTYPLNYYGKTKLESENILIGSGRPYVIFRPSVLYSSNISQNNFFKWVYCSLKNNININVVDDQISSPTFIPELVKAIFTSVIVDYQGLLHIGSNDVISRYEFAVLIAKVFNFDEKLITKIKTSDLNQDAIRPMNSSLNNSKIKDVLDLKLSNTNYYLNKIKNLHLS
tara:strand:+ start:184 stop:1056 length:873 start_codon:yes stop_codon:yes gene_type:complete